MTGLLILIAAVVAFVAALIAGSEVWATVALAVVGLTLVAMIFAAYARVGLWLWGV